LLSFFYFLAHRGRKIWRIRQPGVNWAVIAGSGMARAMAMLALPCSLRPPLGRWIEALGKAPVFPSTNEESYMSKLLSILVAAVFAVSTGSVFAASHAKAAPAGEKKEEVKKEEMKKDAKPAEKKAEKKDEKAAKKEVKADKKDAKKEVKEEKKDAKPAAKKEEMKKEEKKEEKKDAPKK